MKISENLKKELVDIVLGFDDINKVYVFEGKKLINFHAIRNEGSTYSDLVKFVSKTTDIEIEHEDVALFFKPYDAKQEPEVIEEIETLGVLYEVYQ